jgi:hypothetical protein
LVVAPSVLAPLLVMRLELQRIELHFGQRHRWPLSFPNGTRFSLPLAIGAHRASANDRRFVGNPCIGASHA